MRLSVIAVGRMKGAECELCERYDKRLPRVARPLGLDWRGVAEIGESRADTPAARMEAEAATLLDRAAGPVVALDERGAALSSEAFAAMIGELRDEGTASLAFALGGPDGHGEALRAAAIRTVSFGAMTWPHQLARAMLIEQIYRAATILAGHPYHRS